MLKFVETNSSNSSTGGGNTNPPVVKPVVKQISPSKRWCFVYNNYCKDWKEYLVPKIVGKYSIGEEIGEECGTPHLQGYIEFDTKVRPLSIFDIKNIHWTKCKGDRLSNLNYTQKDGKYIQNFKFEYIEEIDKFFDWENKLLSILKEDPDNRKINWIWEPKGCRGKTVFQKYVFTHLKDVVVLSGKGSDMKNGIVNFLNENNKVPRIVLINIPRSNKKFVSYSGIEEIKDMFFFSGKYEGGMICGPSPHVLVFSNSEPEGLSCPESDDLLLSLDRFNLIRI